MSMKCWFYRPWRVVALTGALLTSMTMVPAGQAVTEGAPPAGALATRFECQADGKTTLHEQQIFDTGTVKLAFAQGPDNGPAIVFVPGMGLRWQNYIPIAQRLCGRFHVFLLDQRGHGASDRAPDRSYRVVDYGRDLALFLRGVVGHPAIVSGHSLGGLVVLWVAANEPTLVAGLNAEDAPYLMSELPRWQTHWIKPMFVELEQRLRLYADNGHDADAVIAAFGASRLGLPRSDVPYEQRIRALGKLLSTLPDVPLDPGEQDRIRAAYRDYLDGRTPTNADFWPRRLLAGLVRNQLHLDPDVAAYAVTGRLNEGFDHREAFGRVKAPTLYWQADRDLVGHLPDADVQSLVDILKANVTTKLVYMPGVGHQIHREAPDRYADEITRFFLPPPVGKAP